MPNKVSPGLRVGGTGRPSMSVFFPAYNDEGSIGHMITTALELLPRFADDYEVIVVNDGSADGTAAVLDGLAKTHSKVRVVHHVRNRGYGGALRSGFLEATKDLVFYTDGDAQYDVRELEKLIPLMTEGVDVVNGYKIKRSDSKRRVLLGAMYKFLARLLFRLPIRDVDCDFRLIRRTVIQEIELNSTSGVVCTEMIYKLHTRGAVFAETPVNHYPRRHGQSQFFTLRRVGKTAVDFFTLWMTLIVWRRFSLAFRRQTKPSTIIS
jgi:glycosyltransferase involved in cell wall biosynthesis